MLNKDSFYNAMASVISTEKAFVGHQSLPARSSISVNTSIRQYVAPTDGYLYLRSTISGEYSWMYCVVSDTGRTSNRLGGGKGQTHEMLIPCLKGDLLKFDCGSANFERINFFSTVGSVK